MMRSVRALRLLLQRSQGRHRLSYSQEQRLCRVVVSRGRRQETLNSSVLVLGVAGIELWRVLPLPLLCAARNQVVRYPWPIPRG